MNSVALASIVFMCAFGGAIVGMAMQAALPDHHRDDNSKNAVQQGVDLIATMTALVLGLLLASEKASYDTQKSEISQMSSKIIYLDRVLAMYGPQAADARATLRADVARAIDRMWPREATQASQLDPLASRAETLYQELEELSPDNDSQRNLKSLALNSAAELGLMRWELFGQLGSTVSGIFLAVVIFWVTVIFIGLGMFSPRNGTVQLSLLLCALSVAGALLLILELDHPFDGLIQIPSAPMRAALQHLGR